MSLLVTNIQRSSFYDGPGIRTTVFLKGCSLRCPWCSNPESISPTPEIYFNEEKCLKMKGIDCNKCLENCHFNNIKNPKDFIKNDVNIFINKKEYEVLFNNCPTGAIGIYGRSFEVDELVDLLKRDKNFYNMSGGGVTFSGGEALIQSKELINCLKKLKKEKIHICIETSLFVSPDLVDLVKDFVDLFIIDIKILDPKKCREYLKGNPSVYVKNVEEILKSKKNYIFRFIVVKPFTFSESNIYSLYNFIKEWGIKNLEIFSVHNLAIDKYKSLGEEPPYFEKVEKEELDLLKNKLSSLNVRVKILTI